MAVFKSERNFALRPDAQGFDEIRIVTEPRFKESELSGSEWRISARIDFIRKGNVIVSDSLRDIETASGFLYARLMEAIDNGNGYYAGNGIDCDQEGCKNKAKYIFKIKQGYNRGIKDDTYNGYKRCFCDKHKSRGDQDREDCDSNYELLYIIE